MSEMHLKKPRFTYSDSRPFTKNKERIKKFKETEDSICIYQNELDKARFPHDMVYGDFKELPRRTTSDEILLDKAFNIAKNSRYDGYQRGLASMLYNFFDKKLELVLLKMKSVKIKNYLNNYTNQLLKNLNNKKCTHFLWLILRALI